MKRKKINQITVIAFLLTVIPSLILILGLFTYTILQNDNQSQLLLKEYEQNVVQSFERTISQMDTRMKDISHSQNFRVFANSSNLLAVNKRSADLLDVALRDIGSSDEAIAALFYNTRCDTFSKVSKNSGYITTVYDELLTRCRESSIISETSLFTLQTQEEILVVYHLVQRYGNLFLVLNPSENPDFRALSRVLREDEKLCFSVGDISCETYNLHHDVDTNVEGLSLHYSRNTPSLNSLMDQSQRFILPLIILTVLAIPVVFVNFLRRLIDPMHHLTRSFKIVGDGNREYRIHQENPIQEINEIFSGFDTMMDNINTAEERDRRSQLDAIQAKLQYLQLQIRPHFFLNCLKNIYSMADLKKTDDIQELVLFLSQYLRYSFQDVTAFTSLTSEMEAVKGYVGLMKCMSPGAELEFSLDSEILNAKCIPLTALTFVENCFKYQKDVNPLKIVVKASMFQEEGEPFVKIRIKNNGGGFDPEVMEEINAADPAQFAYRSNRVGISNVKYRLWHSYQGKTSVYLSSENQNAIVEIRFPYLPMEEFPEERV